MADNNLASLMRVIVLCPKKRNPTCSDDAAACTYKASIHILHRTAMLKGSTEDAAEASSLPKK